MVQLDQPLDGEPTPRRHGFLLLAFIATFVALLFLPEFRRGLGVGGGETSGASTIVNVGALSAMGALAGRSGNVVIYIAMLASAPLAAP